jgi:hypothetical protein
VFFVHYFHLWIDAETARFLPWLRQGQSLITSHAVFLAPRPHERASPKVTAISTAYKTRAILLPFLARGHIVQRCPQKSGSNTIVVLMIHGGFPSRPDESSIFQN